MKFKEIAGSTFAIVGSIALVVGGMFFFGKVGNKYLATIGKERADVKREVFKEGKSYVEGMIEDLSNYKREFERTDDMNEKEQIVNMIDAEFSNFDINKIENTSLYNFIIDIREGNWR